MTDRTPRSLLTTVIIAAVLAAGCTNSAAEPTLSPSTPTPTATSEPDTSAPATSTPSPTPSPTPLDTQAPTQDELVDLVNAFRNVGLQVPPLPVDEAADHIAVESAKIITPDGTAQQLTDRIIAQLDPKTPIIRGISHAAILDNPSPDVPDWTATGCVATEGQHTMVETGDPAETDPFVSNYTEVDLRVTPDGDGGWLLHDYIVPDDPIDRVKCVPPDIAEAVTANFDETNRLLALWATSGQPQELLAPVKPLVTQAFFDDLQETVGDRTSTYDPDTEVTYGFEITQATPEQVDARWCHDLSRDPTARSTDNATGEVIDLSQQEPIVGSAVWTKVSGAWLEGPSDAEIADPEGDNPCF